MRKVKIAVFYDNLQYKNRIEYVFKNIFSHRFLENYKIDMVFNPKEGIFDKEIYYTKEINIPTNGIYIKPQNIIFSNKIYESKRLYANKYKYNKMQLYSVEKEFKEENYFSKKNIINFDIIETIFFHLSRYEEFYAKEEQLDHHQRMKSSEQFLVINNLEKIPIVDHIIYSFLDFLNFEKLQINTKYSMTHDIDAIRKFPSFYKFLRANARIIIKDKNFYKLIKLWKQYFQTKISGKDPYDTFEWLLTENKALEKIIYFMSGGRTKHDNFYSVKDPKLKKIFNLAKENGYIIGLHPSYVTPFDKEQFRIEINNLETYADIKVQNTRQHILHFSFKDTISILEELNIKYDSTLGYQDLIGFRCGIGNDYYLYNFSKEKISSVKEIPLIVMDGPLLMEADYNVEKAKSIILDFMNKNSVYTKVTFNFHNSTFDDLVTDAIKLKKLYLILNQYFRKHDDI